MNSLLRFIIIDDDPLSNSICRLIIMKALKGSIIQTFISPEKGLASIAEEFSASVSEIPVILFLDINMPAMNGWEFLGHYHNLDDKIKNQIRIYILSSSVDEQDKERGAQNEYVIDYIEKPLRKQVLFDIASSL